MTPPITDGASRAARLSATLSAMRDVHIALRELQAAEARLFELVESSARLEIDELAADVVAEHGAERDPTIDTAAELNLR